MKPEAHGTREIHAFARRFASGVLPGPRGRGDEPIVRRRTGPADEADACARWLLDRHRAGHAWHDMAVLAPGKRNWRDRLSKSFALEGIPVRMLLGEPASVPDFAADHVHVMTLYAVSDFEFPALAIVGIGDLPWKQQTLEDAARLLFVAMTRATGTLAISYSKPSALVERLLAV